MTVHCRVCWESNGDTIYELPCKCKGSVGMVHMTCFVHTMRFRAQAGQGDSCDVCRARIPMPVSANVMHYHCMCYYASFVFLLYLFLASACCIRWVHQFDQLVTPERYKCIIQFSAVFVCLQPTLCLTLYMFTSLHLALHKNMAGDATSVYTHFLATHGRVVAAV